MDVSSESCNNCFVSMPVSQDLPEGDDALAWTAALARGDEEAFRFLFDRYHIRLYRYLLVVASGNESHAQEALQQAMIRVAGKIKPMATHEDFWRWLTVVARNALRDIVRRQGRYKGMLSRFSDWFSLGLDNRLGDGGDRSELIYDKVLTDVLDSLKPDDRFLIQGKYFERFSVKEMAQKLEITPKAVESKLTRLRVRIKNDLLKRLGNEEAS